MLDQFVEGRLDDLDATSSRLAGLRSAAPFNVPLNNELATYVDPSMAEARIARDGFETVWNRWNLVRSILSAIGAFAVASATVASRERR